jgi:hypothetical protein
MYFHFIFLNRSIKIYELGRKAGWLLELFENGSISRKSLTYRLCARVAVLASTVPTSPEYG